MSNAAITWAKKQKTGHSTRKAVLVAIADYADEMGRCWPSQKRIAEDTEFGERTVRRALSELEEMGFIKRDNRHSPDKMTYMSDIIILGPDIGRDEASQRPAATSQRPLTTGQRPSVQEPAANGAGASGHSRQDPAANLAAKPLIEPSQEPSGETPKRNAREELKHAVDNMFSQFWLLYPNKIGIADARAKFTAAILSEKVNFEALMAGLKAYVNKADDRAWCNPATWIFQERWNDVPAQKPVAQSKLVGTGIGKMRTAL